MADLGSTKVFGDLQVTGEIKGEVTGNATSATKLETARTIALSGDVAGSASFDGTGNVTLTATVQDDSHNHTIANVDGLQGALDSKVPNTDTRLTNSREWAAETVSQAEAEAGTATTRRAWTAQRVRQAINAVVNSFGNATTTVKGWMSPEDKTKLNGIATGATKNATDAQLRDRATHTGTQPLSTISDAGTAAGRDVTTSATDTTTGRITKVGDFGIGATVGALCPDDNTDNALVSGVYRTQESTANLPPVPAGTQQRGTLIIGAGFNNLTNNAIWLSTHANRMFTRTRNNGSWGSWVEVQNELNIGSAAKYNVGTSANQIPSIADADSRYLKEADNLNDLPNKAAARSNLGLGTAATADVTTSRTNNPYNVLLRAGDYGIGNNIKWPHDDLDTITGVGSGFYQFDDVLNRPTYAYGNLLYIRDGGGATQLAFSGAYANDATSFHIHYRRRPSATGVWSPWAGVFNSENDGPGSGLDADTVDGVEASQFFRLDQSNTYDVTGQYLIFQGDPATRTAIRFTNNGEGTGVDFRMMDAATNGNCLEFSGDNVNLKVNSWNPWSTASLIVEGYRLGESVYGEIEFRNRNGDVSHKLRANTSVGLLTASTFQVSDGTATVTANTAGATGLRFTPDGTAVISKDTNVSNTSALHINRSGFTSGTTWIQTFWVNNSAVGAITSDGTSTTYGTTSDYRAKTNIVPLEDGIDRLKQLPVRRFSFINSPEVVVDGFIAHEVQAVIPEAVVGEKDATEVEEYEITPAELDENGEVITPAVMGEREVPIYQSIDQSKVVPLLTAALKEAVSKIEALEARVDRLEVSDV